jgi:hypothetical protein
LVDGMEEIMNRLKCMHGWSVAVGAMDALTGLLLVLVPSFVLGLLGIPAPGDPVLVFVSWIGVFVMGVGLSYGLVFGSRRAGALVWTFTAGIRLMVCVFLTIQVVAGRMPAAWMWVAGADGFVAAVQLRVLRLGWWKEARG